jgi:hypothetical protein
MIEPSVNRALLGFACTDDIDAVFQLDGDQRRDPAAADGWYRPYRPIDQCMR